MTSRWWQVRVEGLRVYGFRAVGFSHLGLGVQGLGFQGCWVLGFSNLKLTVGQQGQKFRVRGLGPWGL